MHVELVEGKSKKFWEIELIARTITTRWGRIGTAGQSKKQSFPSAPAARSSHDKQVVAKQRKGYRDPATRRCGRRHLRRRRRATPRSRRPRARLADPVSVGQGERIGQRPRYLNIREPLSTVVACGQRHAMAAALLAPFVTNNNSIRETGGWNVGARVDGPMPTITAQRQKALVAAHLVKFAGTSPSHLASCASSMRDAVPTITAGGWKIAQVAAFLVRYNRTSIGQSLKEPASTIDTTDRLGLVSVMIDGWTYVIADILMRMLDPRKLFRASDFDDDYIIDPIYNGKPLTRTAQVRMCGNAVPPAPVAAIVGAQFPELAA